MSDKIAPRLANKGFGMLRVMVGIKKQVDILLDERIEKRIERAEDIIREYRLGHVKGAETLWKHYVARYLQRN